jgi:thioredoxin-related protein
MKTLQRAILAILLLVSFVSSAQDIQTIETGKKIPGSNTELQTMDGSTTSIQKEMGPKGLIVIFSCNTCPFVVGSEAFAGWERTYNEIFEQAKALGINVILVNSNEAKRDNEDAVDAMKRRAEEMGYKMPYLIDVNSTLANEFGAKTTPHVFFIDAENTLVYTGCIDNTYDGKRKKDELYLLNLLEEFKKKGTITPTSTPPRGCSIKRVKL